MAATNVNRLKEKYTTQILPQLVEEYKLTTSFAAPKIEKVVVNMGVTRPTEPRERKQAIDNIVEQFKVITGLKPQVALARKSIAGFKLRAGDPVGVMVTLRGQHMWEFLDKVISITLPRVKDFRGVSKVAFDPKGNYNLGISEQIVFPEINYDAIESVRGLQVTVVVRNGGQGRSLRMLELLGMPFEKKED